MLDFEKAISAIGSMNTYEVCGVNVHMFNNNNCLLKS